MLTDVCNALPYGFDRFRSDFIILRSGSSYHFFNVGIKQQCSVVYRNSVLIILGVAADLISSLTSFGVESNIVSTCCAYIKSEIAKRVDDGSQKSCEIDPFVTALGYKCELPAPQVMVYSTAA